METLFPWMIMAVLLSQGTVVKADTFPPEVQKYLLSSFNEARFSKLPISAEEMEELQWDLTLQEQVSVVTCAHGRRIVTYQSKIKADETTREDVMERFLRAVTEDEFAEFKASLPSDLKAGDPVGATKHTNYTQIVWGKSKRVGCAYSICDSGNYGIACAFSPLGNVVGAPAFIYAGDPEKDDAGSVLSTNNSKLLLFVVGGGAAILIVTTIVLLIRRRNNLEKNRFYDPKPDIAAFSRLSEPSIKSSIGGSQASVINDSFVLLSEVKSINVLIHSAKEDKPSARSNHGKFVGMEEVAVSSSNSDGHKTTSFKGSFLVAESPAIMGSQLHLRNDLVDLVDVKESWRHSTGTVDTFVSAADTVASVADTVASTSIRRPEEEQHSAMNSTIWDNGTEHVVPDLMEEAMDVLEIEESWKDSNSTLSSIDRSKFPDPESDANSLSVPVTIRDSRSSTGTFDSFGSRPSGISPEKSETSAYKPQAPEISISLRIDGDSSTASGASSEIIGDDTVSLRSSISDVSSLNDSLYSWGTED